MSLDRAASVLKSLVTCDGSLAPWCFAPERDNVDECNNLDTDFEDLGDQQFSMNEGLPELDTYVTREMRVLMFVDIAESARLFEQDEAGMVSRWLRLVEHFTSAILPPCRGRVVKSLGDGLLLEFDDVLGAVSTAFTMHHACHRDNAGRSEREHLLLRIGVEAREVFIVAQDVLGHGVNLTARLSALAGPGETVVSAAVRERLTSSLDADIEDLGDRYVKHIDEAVRAYRVGPPGPRPVLRAGLQAEDLRPTLAIIPFRDLNAGDEHRFLGEIIAEELVQELSPSQALNVISRFSTSPFRFRTDPAAEIIAHLSADYMLSGHYHAAGERLILSLELAEAKSGRIAWTRQMVGTAEDFSWAGHEALSEIVQEVVRAISTRELQRVRLQPAPTLKSYTLLMAALTLMHRMSLSEFELAKHLLETLVDRRRRDAVPHAWLAKWYVLRVQQGWSADPAQDARQALECAQRALDADPSNSLALAIDGVVQTHFVKRLDIAHERYCSAVELNPNDSLAWVLKGTMHAFRGEGEEAVNNTQRALSLSPLDPHRYYYDSLAGTAYLAAGDYETALECAERSLRANRSHTSTLRVATIAAWRTGRHDVARAKAQRLLELEPNLTIRGYLSRSPAAPFVTGRDWADALRQAGVPE